ncbi:hypothetical protein EON65_35780 [archaeon]|nr:MAG: hypothetical protein EON65_35780 [archaeon]
MPTLDSYLHSINTCINTMRNLLKTAVHTSCEAEFLQTIEDLRESRAEFSLIIDMASSVAYTMIIKRSDEDYVVFDGFILDYVFGVILSSFDIPREAFDDAYSKTSHGTEIKIKARQWVEITNEYVL